MKRALVLAVMTLVLAGCSTQQPGSDSFESASPSPTAASTPSATTAPPPPAASPTPSPTPETLGLGAQATVGSVSISIESVDVFSSIPATDGGTLTPPDGGQLVLFSTTYSNSIYQADLSCGSTDLYIQVFDDQGREMTQVFETYRIAGNPGCNEYLLQDTAHAWNFAFQSVEGAVPVAMSLTNSNDFNETVWINLQA